MVTNNCIDVKIALFIKRVTNYYIKKRVSAQLEKQERNWLAKFNGKNVFVHRLTEDLCINLYRDSILCKLIFDGFEENGIDFLKKYLKKGDVFFDIGANIGVYSLFASRIIGDTGRVYAFEPTPRTFERLLDNIKLNNLNNIKSNNFGLSNSKESVEFHISNDGHDAWNSIANLDLLHNGSTIKVNVETLDSFIKICDISSINLVKLDVEGWEKFVLEGGKSLLSQINPPVFIVEFSEDYAFAAGYYCGEVYDYMKSFGFEWYSFNSMRNELRKEVKKLHYPYENLIAMKNHKDCCLRVKCKLINS